MKIVYVVNVDSFFLSHRLPLAQYAIKQGHQVYVLTADSGYKKEIVSYGINFIEIPFERAGMNPFHELKCIRLLCKYYRQIKPDIIHHVTLKSALLGSIAAKMSKCKNVVNALSGLGYNFTDNRRGIAQYIIMLMIKLAFRSNTYSFILQNKDDLSLIRSMHLVPENNVFLIEGSGVDLNQYSYISPIRKEKQIVLFPARILKDKGIIEYLRAANYLHSLVKSRAKFIIAGNIDTQNPSSLKEEDFVKWLIPGYIEWVGFKNNMYEVYKYADIVVLPSYREGLPKSLIEACAVGRPIITTDAPGCKECVVEGENGYIVPVKDIEKLANRISLLLSDNSECIRMGVASRRLAEMKFSIDIVIQKTFNIYNKYK